MTRECLSHVCIGSKILISILYKQDFTTHNIIHTRNILDDIIYKYAISFHNGHGHVLYVYSILINAYFNETVKEKGFGVK